MSFSSWKDFREIVDEDERLITITLLIDIGQNLLVNPQREQHRVLPQQYVDEVFAAYPSALACLRDMGFDKSNDDLVFDASTRKETLEKIVAILEGKQVEGPSTPVVVVEKKDHSSLVPPIEANEEKNWTRAEQLQLRSTFAERFPIRSTLKQVQSYEDKALREFIRKEIIPLDRLCQRVEEKELPNPLDRRDALVVELLSWFKEEFFTWFDQSFCERCSKPMKFLRFTPPTERQRTEGDAQRVELYRCEICSSEETFPRYNNVRMLLKTRSGRCGEAANLFTCLCRALSFEARYIHDPSDHVWTEFFSVAQQRWIHCDACENLSDSPLMYEQGWKKQLQFCLAFAKDHLEDVTWRYVTDFPATIQRRKIDEKQFERFFHRVNTKLQKNLAPTTKKQISLLRMRDLVEMLRPRTLSADAELNGRQSGSLQWRLSRQETQQKAISSRFVYRITDEEMRRGSMTVEYNSVDDEFSRNEKGEGAKWNERFFSYANLQRKVEKDWKMVYLARKDLHQTGWAKIQFELPSSEQHFGHIRVDCPVHQFDQFGSVQVFLNYGDEHVPLSSSSSSFEYDFPSKSIEKFELELVLSSSNDDNDANAWQKTQLFRQSILPASSNDRTHLFRIELNFPREQ